MKNATVWLVISYAAVLCLVTQRSSPRRGALRDETKNGCVGDYVTCLSIKDCYMLERSHEIGKGLRIVIIHQVSQPLITTQIKSLGHKREVHLVPLTWTLSFLQNCWIALSHTITVIDRGVWLSHWPCFHERFFRSLSEWQPEIAWKQLLFQLA